MVECPAMMVQESLFNGRDRLVEEWMIKAKHLLVQSTKFNCAANLVSPMSMSMACPCGDICWKLPKLSVLPCLMLDAFAQALWNRRLED
jgi:hypothetical protein